MKSKTSTTIVVVDDDEDTASLLRELLERRGYRAVAVLSGDRCLEFLVADVADAAIIDLHMPGMSGIELCRELGVRHPDVAAIVLTGMADRSSSEDAIGAGARDAILKPARIERVEAAIERAITGRGGPNA